ncbi:MAG: outer membrane protein OmpA-like peptidoglycan-associated protein [Sulfitobacter sp.]|jgi:OmpA-OmpF porin, OOP family
MISHCGKYVGAALAIAITITPMGFAAAQNTSEMTAEEITQAFEKQKTRGLVLVPAGDAAAPAATESTSVQGTETAYSEVAKSDQVNIKIKFDFDSATLRDDQKTKLSTMCQVMKTVDVKLFQIVGHTDSSGSASYNKNLSLLRAQEVKRHLVNDCGIDENRLEAVGLGESAPFDAENSRSDDNRRVEFQALG